MDIRTDLPNIIKDIEAKAKASRVSISKICKEIQISRSTFDRWKRGENEPSLNNIQRIYIFLDNASKSLK